MPPYRPHIPPPGKEGSWLPVILFAVVVLAWIGAILQPFFLALLER
jgi:hypothetical protein